MTTTEPRQRLLQVALQLFVARGYDAVGVQEIVTRAEVTKPTLYHHHGNKRGLLDALALEIESCLFDLLDGATRYTGDLPRDLEALIERLLRFGADRRNQARLLLIAQHGPANSETREALDHVWQRLRAELEGFFEQAGRDHGNMRGRQRDLTIGLLGTVFAYIGLVMNRKMNRRAPSAHAIMRQFSYGIYS